MPSKVNAHAKVNTVGLDYKSAGPTVSLFLRSNLFVRGIRGPFGSGKSVACCVDILRRSMMQKPYEGKRKSRWAIIRNTYPQLKTTTVKTWRDWFGDEWGKFVWTPPYEHQLRFTPPDGIGVYADVHFFALDKPEHVRNLLSLELTGAWVNEAREVSKGIIDALTGRVGRYPRIEEGGPSWAGLIMDTNSPDEDHWWPIMAGDTDAPDWMTAEERLTLVRPENWKFFAQPPAMLETKNEAGELTGYDLNPERENKPNLLPSYYNNLIQGKTRIWINCYVMNRYQTLMEGKSVYPTFREDTHVLKSPPEVLEDEPLYCGMDFGRTPAAIFVLKRPGGRLVVVHEFIASNMGTARFARLMLRDIALQGWDVSKIEFWGDPSGSTMSQTEDKTPFMVLRANGIICRPAPSNDPEVRIEAVEGALGRLVDGFPVLTVSPLCRKLIAGFLGGYQFRRMQLTGKVQYETNPEKNKFSHPHDALQYVLLGLGEGRVATLGRKKAHQAAVKLGPASWNPLKAVGKKRRQDGHRRRLGF